MRSTVQRRAKMHLPRRGRQPRRRRVVRVTVMKTGSRQGKPIQAAVAAEEEEVVVVVVVVVEQARRQLG
jgi:Na+-transporting methylmalonyl-CoA/oxaloacetate decarboxylase gamma subunit